MTNPPQDLADRLEKALGNARNEAAVNFRSAWEFDKARYDLADLIGAGDNAATILASLRRSAPASGEMGEACQLAEGHSLKITFCVVAYDEGGYGDNRSRDFEGEDCEGKAIAYAKSLPAQFGATITRRTTMQPISVKIYPPPRTPSGETREEIGE